VIIPAKVFVEDDGSTETSSRVDTSASDWDGGQVHQEHSEPNGQGCQNLIISSILLLTHLYMYLSKNKIHA